ncbi:homoserine dehydrogenase [candidate division KSB3 bacterium]|uniref:Homoserine dehydrogenase n=1 Tax=candidate division KSB3 bacterium TaxID=2044937 RepID=A0A9D5Q748_9BACT|nr:homoserine dehydrogenase [candidate division KSB3 bacterium]MBD3325516.1 homoserine dehydrogenase [candidate division KSB3 bacterium]
MKTLHIGLIGFGTVGTGVVKTLLAQQTVLQARTGLRLEVAKIADLDLTTDRQVNVDSALLTTNADEILDDPKIDIVIELIGGYEPARTFILKALRNGKHVVTANKALLAVHGQEIFDTATQHQVDVGFEASVGGGIPIIRSVREGLVANNFSEIYGILNGTTNYILTEMAEKGESFAQVLQRAQDLGFAEADPTFDIEGIDAAHKIVLLTYLAFGQAVKMNQVFTEGVSHLQTLDITFARELGYTVKLIAIAKCSAEQVVEVRVHPMMLPNEHLLAKVDGSFNAVYVVGDIVDSTMFYGRGAGMMPTASAVVSDIVEIARNIDKGIANRLPLLPNAEDAARFTLQAPNRFRSRYYLRFTAIDRYGVLSKISGVLAEHKISIASVIQKEVPLAENTVPVVMLTYEASEHDMQQALIKIDQLDVLTDTTVVIRVL